MIKRHCEKKEEREKYCKQKLYQSRQSTSLPFLQSQISFKKELNLRSVIEKSLASAVWPLPTFHSSALPFPLCPTSHKFDESATDTICAMALKEIQATLTPARPKDPRELTYTSLCQWISLQQSTSPSLVISLPITILIINFLLFMFHKVKGNFYLMFILI